MVGQEAQLPLRLDPFGDHPDAEAVRQADDRGDDRAVLLADLEVGDEAAVDLERVDRELLEVGERGVAGPEVVDGDPYADGAERRQHLDGEDGVLHGRALGDLDLEVARVEAGLLEDAADARRQAALLELQRRQVDGEAQVGLAGGVPGHRLLAGAAQRPLADRHDQARLFRHRDEGVGRHQAAARVLPAQQRLDPGDAAGGEVDLRLVEEPELAALDPLAQVVLERQPLERARVHGRRAELETVAPQLLGAVHGDVGAGQQRLGVAAVGRVEADADAGRDVEAMAVQVHRPRDGGQDLVGHPGGLGAAADVGQQQVELVAADPGHGVALPH